MCYDICVQKVDPLLSQMALPIFDHKNGTDVTCYIHKSPKHWAYDKGHKSRLSSERSCVKYLQHFQKYCLYGKINYKSDEGFCMGNTADGWSGHWWTISWFI